MSFEFSVQNLRKTKKEKEHNLSHQGFSWINILLHFSSKGIIAGCRTEHRVAICVHVDHLTQATACGSDDETTSLWYFNFNLWEKIHVLSNYLKRWKEKNKWFWRIFLRPCKRPWVRSWAVRLHWWHSKIQLHIGIHTCVKFCTFWPLEEKINVKKRFCM